MPVILVILNLFQDLSAHSVFFLQNGALHPPSAFDTPSHTIVGFKVFLRATQAAAAAATILQFS